MSKSNIVSIFLSFFLITAGALNTFAQSEIKPRLEPPSWWIGFKNPVVQVMAYSEDIGLLRPEINHTGVTIEKSTAVENPNYLFIDIRIAGDAKPGEVEINFVDGEVVKRTMALELQERSKGSAMREGFNTTDAIYLLMPDRFANGNPDNDNVDGMAEEADPDAPYGRHGGDLKGISDHLDYIADMGFTAIWLNPVLENNQPEGSYHGYATTDYYQVDPRFGSNEDYKELIQKANEKGLKVIKDMIFNHCGSKHWWMEDLPTEDWINYDSFVQSNYRLSSISDPHASKADLKLATEGWFARAMPDLNLENDLMLNYLIQNSIWWIEYAGLQGIRQDTYPYPDKYGMAEWNKRINQEYPNFNIVGECWIGEASKLSYWQKDANNSDGFNSHLKSIMDFPLMDAMHKAFNENGGGWSDGLMRLYDVLANDFIYADVQNIVIFPENHDVSRIYNILNKDLNSLKMVTAFTGTIRGIPQWYYGTELLMDGNGYEGHSHIRHDFPGGWAGDETNAFTRDGRTEEQNEIYDYLKKILEYRKTSKPIHYGKTLHFVPQNNVYVYFRYLEDEAVMVMLNNSNDESRTIDGKRFVEILEKYHSGKDVMTGENISSFESFEIPAKSARIIELK
ncbi:glycoside hydrolase family 13 protein [Marinilabilia rubra]|uniref:Alpha-amlyase n=1 Tax=Marinilabilia rubra TaxID=2162893 RepID=A0A2U2B8B1_9BACT|nr:glycoside hydrolase family 13 protein [Marinilabilia rubra]PWD99282.1 alpha-amlyase [Marinilabilia rubra]